MVTGLTLLAFIIGPLLTTLAFGVVGVLISDGTPEMAGFPYSEQQLRTMMAIDVALGLVAVGLLPVALRRAPESQLLESGDRSEVFQLKEPVSALIAALVIGLLVTASSSAFPAWFIAIVSICSRGNRRWIYCIPPVALVSVAAGFFVFPSGGDLWATLMAIALGIAITALPMVIGLLRWSRRRQIRALRSEAATARREAEALVRAEQARVAKTRAEERTRIAREMHDTLSHRLALISTYAGALDYREDLDRDTVRSTARLVQQTASTASAELRTVLDVLRDDPSDTRPEPDLTLADGLLEEMRSTGVRIDVVVDRPPLSEVPDTASRALYRMLQEALTNAVKHAPGAPIAVRWQGDDDEVHLTVTNPLPGSPSDPRGAGRGIGQRSGFGLIGLDERARALGGNVRTTKTRDEFRLEATVPCRS